jgi:hypothetical protein
MRIPWSRTRKPESRVPRYGRGQFERLEYENGQLLVQGWMHVEGGPLDGFEGQVTGYPRAPIELVARADVQSVLGLPESHIRTGFAFSGTIPDLSREQFSDIGIFGIRGQCTVGEMWTVFHPDYAQGPLPPEALTGC